MAVEPCALATCDRPRRKREWCGRHYAMWRRTGDATTTPRYTVAPKGGVCEVCGSPDLMAKSRRYCSGRCQMRASTARRGDSRAMQKYAACERCGCVMDLMAPGRTHSNANRPSTRKRRSDSRLCGDCNRQRHYRHKFSAEALARRDGATCRICFEPVDMALRWPDPLSPSVDHVIARADGGTDDPSNLQLAHLTCNHLKSKRSGWTREVA